MSILIGIVLAFIFLALGVICFAFLQKGPS